MCELESHSSLMVKTLDGDPEPQTSFEIDSGYKESVYTLILSGEVTFLKKNSEKSTLPDMVVLNSNGVVGRYNLTISGKIICTKLSEEVNYIKDDISLTKLKTGLEYSCMEDKEEDFTDESSKFIDLNSSKVSSKIESDINSNRNELDNTVELKRSKSKKRLKNRMLEKYVPKVILNNKKSKYKYNEHGLKLTIKKVDRDENSESNSKILQKSIISMIRKSKQKLNCQMCGFSCTGKWELRSHVSEHITGGKTVPKMMPENIQDHNGTQIGKRKYFCCLCGDKSRSARALIEHIQEKHSNQILLACKICEYLCKSSSELFEHCSNQHMENGSYKCWSCHKLFDSMNELEKHHNEAHSLSNTVTCVLCFAKFSTKSLLKEHTVLYHGSQTTNIFPCGLCEYSTDKYDSLRNHVEGKHSNETPFICSICGHAVKTKKRLREHVRNHNDTRIFQCKECGLICKSMSSLSGHKRNMHTNVRKYHCEFCGQSFKSCSNWKQHILHNHSDNRPYRCSICSYTAKTIYMIKRHERRHTGIKEHSCSLCTFKTSDAANLKYHVVRKHGGGNKNICCHICGMSFYFNFDFKEHMRRKHMKKSIKTYKCAFCTYSTENPNSLSGHIEAKHSNKTFECNICKLQYKSEQYLKRHVRYTHSNDAKVLACNICDFKTKNPTYLKSHIKRHTASKQYQCYYCTYASKNLYSLKRHVGNRHKDKLHSGLPYIFFNNGIAQQAVHKRTDCQNQDFHINAGFGLPLSTCSLPSVHNPLAIPGLMH